MILETLRIISAWLADGTNGVNAKLAGLTLDGSDTVPPDVVTIIESSSSDLAAVEQLLPSEVTGYPVLGVVQMSQMVGPAVLTALEKEYTGDLGVWYLTRDSSASAALQDGLYTMRAVAQSLTELAKNENAASRLRNSSVGLQHIDSLTFLPVATRIGDATVTAACQLTVRIRDLEPT